VETGEAREDGQYHRGAKRRDPRWRAGSASPPAKPQRRDDLPAGHSFEFGTLNRIALAY